MPRGTWNHWVFVQHCTFVTRGQYAGCAAPVYIPPIMGYFWYMGEALNRNPALVGME